MSEAAPMVTRWRQYVTFYRNAAPRLTASVGLSVGQSLVVLPIAYLVKRAFDHAIPAGEIGTLAGLVGALFGLYLLNILVTLATRHLGLSTTKRAIADIRMQLLDRLYALPRRAFHGSDHARLHTVIVQDTERVDVMSNALLSQVVPALTLSIALSGWLALLNPRLFVVTICSLPLAVLANRWLGARVRRHVAAFYQEFERFSGLVWQALRLMDLTRAQAAEDQALARQASAIEALRTTSAHMAWLSSAYTLVQGGLTALTGLIILLVGGAAVARGRMTLGDLVSFYVGTTFLSAQASAVFSAIPAIINGDESLKNVMDMLQQGDRPPYEGARRVTFAGGLVVEHVSFDHDGCPILHDLSLTVPAHSSLAIVGPNGAGKSTLAYLLLGFYRPHSGRVLADDVAYDELDVRHLRRAMGVVMQDAPMLNGTILENITYGAPDAGIDDVVMAARTATAEDFIAELPQGYDTLIGEDGVRLSGGQRQQVALARALLGRPAFLLLDEPTNHLDRTSVKRLIENLKSLPNRPTIVMTTHDEDVAACCDRVIVLERGDLAQTTEPPRRALV